MSSKKAQLTKKEAAMKKIQKLANSLLVHGVKANVSDDSINGMWLGKALLVSFDIDHTKQQDQADIELFTTADHCSLCFARFALYPITSNADYFRGESAEFKDMLIAVYCAQSIPSFRDCKIGANVETQTLCLRLAFAITNKQDGTRLETEFDCWVRLCQLGGLGDQVTKIMESLVNA